MNIGRYLCKREYICITLMPLIAGIARRGCLAAELLSGILAADANSRASTGGPVRPMPGQHLRFINNAAPAAARCIYRWLNIIVRAGHREGVSTERSTGRIRIACRGSLCENPSPRTKVRTIRRGTKRESSDAVVVGLSEICSGESLSVDYLVNRRTRQPDMHRGGQLRRAERTRTERNRVFDGHA